MSDPWRIYVLFSETGHIRKWDFTPFEIDGIRATEFHSASVHGLHTCSDACDRPLCVARRTIERQQAEIARLRAALAGIANRVKAEGSPYHTAILALDALVYDVRRQARQALAALAGDVK